MGAFVMAWLIGEGIVIYRTIKTQKAPPGPGQLLITSGVFVMLGLLAESDKARPLAITLAYGFDIAAFMNLFGSPPVGAGGQWPPGQLPSDVTFPGSTINGSGSSLGGIGGELKTKLT